MKQFQWAKMNKPKSSVFDLSHEKKMTLEMGNLTPTLMQEVIPGDKFKVDSEVLLRFQPLLAPIMHRINVYMHYFFVPYRIIWDDFEDFITGGITGEVTPNMPCFYGTNKEYHQYMKIGGLADYLGIPVQQLNDTNLNSMPSISMLPFRAYQQIYNDYYLDRNLQEEVDIYKTSTNCDLGETPAPEEVYLLDIRKRCWEKDYFTSALVGAQRGDEMVFPLVGSAPVTGRPRIKNNDTVPATWLDDEALGTGTGAYQGYLTSVADQNNVSIEDGLTADLTGSATTSIQDMRQAFAIQRWLERSNRGGSRYIEQILAFFGVKSKDSRLQRAEYLGGGKIPVMISEVLQTSETGSTAQGNLAGHGVAAGVNAGFTRYFTEHGIIMGIMSVMPRTAYCQGIPRLFLKDDKYDFFWPDLAHLGEQVINSCELWVSPTNPTLKGQYWGYQERYAEYRFAFDSVHGDLRDSLDFWHLARIFDTKPELNDVFVEANPDTRIFPVEVGQFQHLIAQVYNKVIAIRPIPKFGTPI